MNWLRLFRIVSIGAFVAFIAVVFNGFGSTDAETAVSMSGATRASVVFARTSAPVSPAGDPAGFAAGECNKCLDDCDDPPPSHWYCTLYCYPEGLDCWPCTGWEPNCLEGDCESIVSTYWEGELECGEACPGKTGIIVEPCGGGESLDGTSMLDAFAAEPTTIGAVEAELTPDGSRYRQSCNGAVIARRYTSEASARILASLEVLRL
jgi:hypothetical protein